MTRIEWYRGRAVAALPCGAGSEIELRAAPGSLYARPYDWQEVRIDFVSTEIPSYRVVEHAASSGPRRVFVEVALPAGEIRPSARVWQDVIVS